MAQKHANKRFEDDVKKAWLEMGLLSITFTAYTAPDGRIVIDV